MRILFLGLSVAAISGLTARGSAAPARTVSTVCLPPDNYTAFQINALKEIVTGTDSGTVILRQDAHIPAVADTAVHVESDSTKCAQALATYNANVDGSSATALYLLRAGTVYVASVNNLAATGREWTEQLVMDSSFVAIGTYLR